MVFIFAILSVRCLRHLRLLHIFVFNSRALHDLRCMETNVTYLFFGGWYYYCWHSWAGSL